jgi:ribosomal protein L15
MKNANYESGAGHGQQGIINIGVLDQNFEANDLITLSVLKEKGLISKKVGRMKVLADGILNKPLTIKSESYSIQAIKMIELTGGTVIILRD